MTLTGLTALNAEDVVDYRRAVDDGYELMAQLDADLPEVPDGGVLVVPTMPNRNGVATFILKEDLRAALRLRRGERPPPIRVVRDDEDPENTSEEWVYDRETGVLSNTRSGR